MKELTSTSSILDVVCTDLRIFRSGGHQKRSGVEPVSYTHLDVYKRQVKMIAPLTGRPKNATTPDAAAVLHNAFSHLVLEIKYDAHAYTRYI